MKKRINSIPALVTGVISLVSCNIESDGRLSYMPDEIRFCSNGIRVETRAFTEVTDSSLQADGFKVAAILNADNSVMFNESVTYNNSTYGIAIHPYYYPDEGTLSFYAVYPKTQPIIALNGAATLNYSQNADTDLAVASATGVAKRNSPVMLDFEHILSQISFTVKTDNANVDCELESLTVTSAAGGHYSYADGVWTPSATTDTTPVIILAHGTTKAVTTTSTAIGSSMSFLPGTIQINAKWKCYNKSTQGPFVLNPIRELASDNDQTVEVEIAKGKHSILNLTLPSNSSEMSFVSSVGAWVDASDNIVMEYTPAAVNGIFTVDSSGKKVKFAKGNLYWNGKEFRCEEHQFDVPAVGESNHAGVFNWRYNDAGSDAFFAKDGGAIEGWTVLTKDEWQHLLDHNLCRNNSDIYIDSYNESFWFIGTYEEAKAAFEADEVEQGYYPGQSFDDVYDKGFISKHTTDLYNVAGMYCMILKPDGFDGEIKSLYTASEWAEAEKSGLVALPTKKNYAETGIRAYWSCTPYGDVPGYILWMMDYESNHFLEIGDDVSSYAVRLVQTQ